MKKGLTELVFVLDRSGSMGGLESDTIGGFNSMIEKQKREPGEAFVTTVLFDDQYEMIHNRFKIEMIRPLTGHDYYARGCTALLDAVGKTIDLVGRTQKYLPEEERAEKVIFVITTDGLENSSREYSYKRLQEMIEHQKNTYNWEFMFLGANMDAVAEAKKFGIGSDRAVTFENDSHGVQLNYEVVGKTLATMRACAPTERVGDEWKAAIEEDHKKRSKLKFWKK